MLLGLIADLHADLDGLRRALGLLDWLGAVHILCAGDLIEKGLDGDAVIHLLRQRAVPCVKGNHEYIAASKHGQMLHQGSPDGLRYRVLSLESADFIAGLPDSLSFTFEGVHVLLTHGTPWADFAFLYPDSHRRTFERVADEAAAEVAILGHTHIPMQARVKGIWIVNPGSVCLGGSRTCATLTLPDCVFEVYRIDGGERVKIETIVM